MARIPFVKKVAQIRTLAGLWRHRAMLFSMFREMSRGTYRASFLTVIALVLGVLYIISPIDLIPNLVFPIIGLVDDGIIFYFLLKRLMHELARYTASRSKLKLVE